MGWLYGWEWDSNKSIREHIVRDCTYTRRGDDVLSQSKVIDTATTKFGRNFWLLVEHTVGNAPPQRFILLCLLNKCQGRWGYKDIDESMGPVEVDCPLRLLEAASPVDGTEGEYNYAYRWRQRVREYHAKARTNYKKGDLVRLGEKPEQFVVCGRWTKGSRYYVIENVETKQRYRTTARHMTGVA